MPPTEITHQAVKPNQPVRGPLELRRGLEEYATPETLALFDKQVDAAVKTAISSGDPQSLAKVLAHWLYCLRVARHEIKPETHGNAREETIRAWEAAHPGEKLFDAA